MKNFLVKMFADKSDINVKAVTGFLAFIAMVLYGMVDMKLLIKIKNYI